MKKDKVSKDVNDEVNMIDKEKVPENCDCEAKGQCECSEAENAELQELKAKLEEKCRQCEDFMGLAQRTAAEFDNYKKRTQKEKEALGLDVSIDIVNTFLPVVDNLERALKAAEGLEGNPLKEGVEMVMRQLKDCMEKLGVEAISAVNNPFDPELHNAVMHVTDESLGENIVIEEFQKGYAMKGKVVRHSMVKVAN